MSDAQPPPERPGDGSAEVAPAPVDPRVAAQVVGALLLFGRLLLASGDAVSDINLRLRAIATAWGAPYVQFIVLPDLMLVSFSPDEPAHIMSRDLAADHLQLDKVTRLLSLCRQAQRGEVAPAEAIAALREIETAKRHVSFAGQVAGTVILTLGAALLFRPDDASLPLLLALGALVGVIQNLSSRVSGLTAIIPVAISFVAATAAFLVTGDRHETAPIEALIPALTVVLPGALLTMSAVDLASGDTVSGSSRFLEGLLQLALLAFGILAAAQLAGVNPSATSAHGDAFGAWAPWLGVVVFAVGVAVRESAPRTMLPWLLLVLFVAHGAQMLGDLLFGAILSGFVGTLVTVPWVQFLERYRTAPPAFALFLPAFLMLVPGALGLLGISELVVTEKGNALDGMVNALAAILAIALGILVGTRVTHIVSAARRARKRLQASLPVPLDQIGLRPRRGTSLAGRVRGRLRGSTHGVRRDSDTAGGG